MKSLSQTADREEILRRILTLTPSDRALWGKMTVHQMVCHVSDCYLLGLGIKSAKPHSGFFQRTVMKWLALRSPTKWPHGIKTRPEFEQGIGGTPPIEFERDREVLVASLQQFCRQLIDPPLDHSIFGPMTQADWWRWGYLHADHHLRQFAR